MTKSQSKLSSAAAVMGKRGAKVRYASMSPEERSKAASHAGSHPRPGRTDRWKPNEDALFPKLSDAEVAKRTGRTVLASSQRRSRLRKAGTLK